MDAGINNLPWTLHDAGRCTEARVEFQLAAQSAERVGTLRQQGLARTAIKACGNPSLLIQRGVTFGP